MARLLHQARRNGTFALLCLSIFIILILALTQPALYEQLRHRVKDDIWPAIIALATFFGFVVGGVLKNPPESFSKFLDNGLLQIAVLELFLFSAGITYVAYTQSRVGQLEMKLHSGQTSPQIKVQVETDQDSGHARVWLVPDLLPNQKPGTYRFTIIDSAYERDAQTVDLLPGEKKTVTLEDRKLEGTLVVNSSPKGADIWVDGSFTSKRTPGTLKVSNRRTIRLQLKKKGFADYESGVNMVVGSRVDLGTILLRRLFSVTFKCLDELIQWSVRGQEYEGSATISLPEGHYIVSFVRRGGSKEKKTISIDGTTTIFIP